MPKSQPKQRKSGVTIIIGKVPKGTKIIEEEHVAGDQVNNFFGPINDAPPTPDNPSADNIPTTNVYGQVILNQYVRGQRKVL